MQRLICLIIILLISFVSIAQPGKDGANSISIANQILNKYSPVSVSISIGSNTLEVADMGLLSLCPGDLIMVYQAQGASMDISLTNSYGNILNYNSSGLYEFKYVQSTSGNTITTQTTFTNSYAVNGKVQVVKVPQYTTLTINSGASLVPKPWKDTLISSISYRFGGLVVIHASNIINNGMITATGSGFRGGVLFNSVGINGGITALTTSLSAKAGEKGESICGYRNDYDLLGGRYGRGSPANGGGGGDGHNAGAGGGGNGYNGNTWSGEGVMIVNVANPITAWGLSTAFITNGNSLTNSSGGGHGGYSYGDANANGLLQGPGNPAWVGDLRREVGGIGGRPLNTINSETRIFFGGGGGAPHSDNNAATSGATGGGIVYLIASGGISGSGNIESNGNSAGNSTGCNCDGLAGGGAGGSIVIKTTIIGLSQNINANGGKGGDQMFPVFPSNPNESEGPGGGGGGGFIAVSAVGPLPLVLGGANGTSLSNAITEMTSNGATAGANGQVGTVTTNFVTFLPIASSSIAIGANSPVCEGTAINLSTSNGASTYSWTGPSGFSSNLQNPTISSASLAMSGTYSVIQIFSSGCQSVLSASVNVTVNPAPIASINCSTLICSGNQFNLSGSGGITYNWAGPASFTSAVQNPVIGNFSSSNTGVYTLTVTDINGCSASAISAPISLSSGPTVTITGDTTCLGQMVNLFANSQPGCNYYWMGPNSFTSVAQHPITGTASASLAGVYQLTVTNASGCSVTSSVNLVVNNNGTPPAITSNSVLCTNSILSLNTSSAQSYLWSGPNGFSSAVQNPTLYVNSIVVTGIYSLTVVDLNNCVSTNTININVNITPTINIISGNTKGCPPLCTTFTCNPVPSGVNCSWNMGNGSVLSNSYIASTCYYSAGIYTITNSATLNGCSANATYTVQVYPGPTADFNYSPIDPVELKDEVIFTDASFGTPIVSWNWYFMNTAQYTSSLQNPVFTYPDAGQYAIALIVKSDKGCTDTILKTIVVEQEFSLYVPNTFTPNEDGVNDTFYAKGHGILKFEMDIYDRWGENIFHSNDINNHWDGTYKSKEKCKNDSYVWKIKVRGCKEVVKELTGHVLLLK